MSADAALQAAILAHLAADPDVLTQLGDPPRLYDRAPGGAAFPYVSLGRAESRPVDGDDTRLSEHRLTLHVWSRNHDFAEVKAITGAVSSALHNASLTLAPPFAAILCQAVYTDVFDGADGRSVHGVVRVRVLASAA